MEEIPFGEMVRVKKAIRILERKNKKPLSTNLNKILCKPLRHKTTMFPPSPFPERQGHPLKRCQSNASIRVKPAEKNIMETAGILTDAKDLRNPLISPGTDKRKTFAEVKALISPALRPNLPKLSKPDLSALVEKSSFDESLVSDQNHSYFSASLSLRNLFNRGDSSSFENSSKNYFFPDEVQFPEEPSQQDIRVNATPAKVIKRRKSLLTIQINDLDNALLASEQPKRNPEANIFKPLSKPATVQSLHYEQRRKEVSSHIAQNLKKLKSMPLITRRLPAMKSQESGGSHSNTYNASLSIDIQPSFQRKNPSTPSKSGNLKSKEMTFSGLTRSRLHKRHCAKLGDTKVLSTRFDHQDQYLGVACEDSIIRIYNTLENNKIEFFLKDVRNLGIATTCIRWRPKSVQKVLLASQATGVVTIWDVREQEILMSLEEDNYVYSCDFDCEGLNYATAGSDTKIRVYDFHNKQPVSVLRNQEENPGHSNRVYNLLFGPDNPNILYSGGWDCNVFIWDLRMGESVNFISGPMICGDSMDLRGNELLTGSWRNEKQIEVWDLRTLKLVTEVAWVAESPEDKSFIYCCRFSKTSPHYIVAGSTAKCELRLFDRRKGYKNADSDRDFEFGIFTLDFRNTKDEFVCGTGGGRLLSYSIR